MVIKRSPGGQACRWRAINFEIHLWSSGKNADCIFGDRSASSMSKWRPAWTLTPEMIHFRTKSVTLSMLIDLLIIVHVDRRRWRAHQLTYELKRCLLFRKCLRFFESESSFGAYVCHRRPGGSMATSHLVGVCVSSWHMWVGWADVGLRVAVCFLAKISLHRRTCKTTFARLTQSQAISQSFRAFISFRWRRDTTFFFIVETLFYTKITVSFTMVIKRSPGGQACRWRAINFEIHLWSSGKNADCIFGDRSASSMSKWRPAWTLTPEMIHFRTKSVTLSMLIDLLIIVHVDRRRWRAHQLTYDLKRCLLFRKCLQLRFFESESSFGAYVCHRRPGGSMATSHLVKQLAIFGQAQWIWWKVFSPKLDNIQECLANLSSFPANYQLPSLKRLPVCRNAHTVGVKE